MDSEANASSAQGCDNTGLAWRIVHSSPHLRAANREKMKFKNRRKVLRISTPAAPNTYSQDNDEDDSDYAPPPLDQGDNAAEGRNRKRCRNQARGHAPNPAAAPPGGAVGSGEEEEARKRSISIRCSPVKFKELVGALNKSLKAQARAKNFGGLLLF